MSSSDNASLLTQEPSSFEVAVRDRSWEWLLELRRRLKVELVLADRRPAVLLPAPHGEHVARLSALLEARDPSLLSAISTALNERAPRAVEVNGIQIVCTPVLSDREASGALLVGRLAPSRQDSTASKGQLEMVAAWLTSAVEAHLLSPPAFPSSGLNRIAPLAQLLGQVSSSSSDRELIRLFGEAIAVWHDVEASGYVETTTGAFARDVTLPGAESNERPAMIAAIGLPETTELTRLPQGHLDRFGLPVHNDVYVRRFRGTNGGSWLLVLTGVIGGYDVQRIGAYVSLLEMALALSSSSFSGRIATTLGRRLAGAAVGYEARASRALNELRTALGAAVATLSIEIGGGRPTLQVTARGGGEETDANSCRVVLVKRCERHYTTTISLGRVDNLPFTPRDHEAVHVAASVFDAWAGAEFDGNEGRRERRSVPREFPELLERAAREGLERGSSVAVVVVLVRDRAAEPESTHRWVAGLRAKLRPSDLAGALGEGEIGLLIRDTGTQQARAIAERVRELVGGTRGTEAVLVGVARRSPGQGPANGIVKEARADAVAGVRQMRMVDSPNGVNR